MRKKTVRRSKATSNRVEARITCHEDPIRSHQELRTLKDVTIPFDSITTFIGPNGTGKSTVLRALDWYFNGKPGH
jgi:ABC-type phosphate transport system ATPase subunit